MNFYAFLTIVGLLAVVAAQEQKAIKAIASFKTATSSGNITFSQASCKDAVIVEVSIIGLTPGKHGFHVHEKGDLSGGCLSTGGHYNPDKLDHGGPTDEFRHVGDLGNILADETGHVQTTITDTVITLYGGRSIIGRGLVIHDGVDDLGRGGHPDSKKTGNAGGRAACAIIGILDPEIPSLCSGCAYIKHSTNLFLFTVITVFFSLVKY